MPPELSHYRTIFISDSHLGLRGTRSDTLLAFLEENNAVLAEKAYSNVSVIRTKKLSDSDLDLALAKCSTEEAPPPLKMEPQVLSK